MNRSIYIIGAGGVGSWLTPLMCKLAGPKRITVVDGDEVTEDNLDRQLFTGQDIGMNKAACLAIHHPAVDHSIAKFYDLGTIDHTTDDVLMVAVDNHPARLSCLAACDHFGCQAIVMANERTSADAYLYQREWRNHPRLDPRVRWPEMLTNTDDDPRARSIGCTGTAQVKTPQLASANYMAASLGAWLYVLWFMEETPADALPHLSYRIIANMNGLERETVNQPIERTNT